MYTEKTKNNKYKFIEFYKDIDGKNKKVTVTLDKNTKQYQAKAFNILQEKIAKKLEIFTIEYRFLDCLQEYEQYKEKNLKKSTMITYNSIIKDIQKKAQNWKFDEIKARHLLSIFNENERNLHYKIAMLKDFIKWCYKKDYIEDITFLQKIQTPKENKKEEQKLFLEKSELDDVLDFYKNDELTYLIITILANTGLRIGELLALNYTDLQGTTLSINKTLYKDILIDTPKTKSSKRQIEVNQTVLQAFKKLRERNKIIDFKQNKIFQGINNMSAMNFHQKLKKYKKIHLHPHLFRHTHASLLIEKGISTEAVSRRLGHSDTKITQKIYIHLTEKIKEKEDKIFRELIL